VYLKLVRVQVIQLSITAAINRLHAKLVLKLLCEVNDCFEQECKNAGLENEGLYCEEIHKNAYSFFTTGDSTEPKPNYSSVQLGCVAR